MARLTAQKTVPCESLTPVLALPIGLAVCPRWLAGMTVASQLRRSSLRIGLLGKWACRKLIAVRPVLTPTVFTSLLRGSLAFRGRGSSLVSLCKVGTVMSFRDLTHMMKQRKLVAHHHSYPLLRFRFQTSDVTAYRLLVRDVVALKQALPKQCSVFFDRGLLHTGFQQIPGALLKIGRPKCLSHCTCKLLPGHRGRIPSLHTKPICRLTC